MLDQMVLQNCSINVVFIPFTIIGIVVSRNAKCGFLNVWSSCKDKLGSRDGFEQRNQNYYLSFLILFQAKAGCSPEGKFDCETFVLKQLFYEL